MKNSKRSNVKSIFPERFFSKERPEIDLKESLKDVTPVEWINKSNKEDGSIDSKSIRKG